MGRLKYLLDSNILSEPARLKPNDTVLLPAMASTLRPQLSGMNWFMAVSY